LCADVAVAVEAVGVVGVGPATARVVWWEGRSRRWWWMWRRRCDGGQKIKQAQRGTRVAEQGECRIWLAGPAKSRSQQKPGGDHGGSNYGTQTNQSTDVHLQVDLAEPS
jgi:hypothetical protein